MLFKDFAKEKTTISRLMEGREKGATKDVVGEVLTLADFDIVKNSQGFYTICIYKEYPDKFFFGGQIITEIITEAVDKFGEDSVREDIVKDPIQWVLEDCKSKSGVNSYTRVTIID